MTKSYKAKALLERKEFLLDRDKAAKVVSNARSTRLSPVIAAHKPKTTIVSKKLAPAEHAGQQTTATADAAQQNFAEH